MNTTILNSTKTKINTVPTKYIQEINKKHTNFNYAKTWWQVTTYSHITHPLPILLAHLNPHKTKKLNANIKLEG